MMTDKSREKTGPETFFADWMKMTTELWDPMAWMWTAFHKTTGITPDSKKDGKRPRNHESWDSAQKSWQAFSQLMSNPETMETLSKGTGMLPEIFLKIAQTGFNNFVNIQKQWLERYGKLQESTKTYKYENLKEDAFKAWGQLYEQEFRKFFKIPQLGLTRFYQEKMIRSMDKFNIYQATVAEFSRLLSLPMEQSFQVLQEKLTQLSDKGDLPENLKKYYQMWIKILEGHYVTLFQSSEYTQALNKTLNAMSEFSEAKKDILQDFFNMLPVPTHKEMDELYKEIYLLKKRIKELEKKK
ncbi:MAG: poly(R)-hydroxyalkanoic acid synthase subunit PhaE [Thermodesulfobacteriota bacterium]|nr:poly(R)-hydroxyalkanoic acid synthase subunit PhaE [Thermodesulfobacteriota bacterium]